MTNIYLMLTPTRSAHYCKPTIHTNSNSIATYLYFIYIYLYLSHIFFFFQAEDGIRDYKVTGVQTCALPICKKGCLIAVITLFNCKNGIRQVNEFFCSFSAVQCSVFSGAAFEQSVLHFLH